MIVENRIVVEDRNGIAVRRVVLAPDVYDRMFERLCDQGVNTNEAIILAREFANKGIIPHVFPFPVLKSDIHSSR